MHLNKSHANNCYSSPTVTIIGLIFIFYIIRLCKGSSRNTRAQSRCLLKAADVTPGTGHGQDCVFQTDAFANEENFSGGSSSDLENI